MRHLNGKTWITAEARRDSYIDLGEFQVRRLMDVAKRDGLIGPDEQFGEGVTRWQTVADLRAELEAAGQDMPATFLRDGDWLLSITIPIIEAHDHQGD
jgi:hypothetical protein